MAFAKGGDGEEHLGGVFVPSPHSCYFSESNLGNIKCHSLLVIIFTNELYCRKGDLGDVPGISLQGFKERSNKLNCFLTVLIGPYQEVGIRISGDHL